MPSKVFLIQPELCIFLLWMFYNLSLPLSLGRARNLILISVPFSSVAQLCSTLCDPMDCSTPGFPVHHQLSELTRKIESVMPSNLLIFCCPLPLLLSISPSIRVFSNESVLHIRWPKYWSFSLRWMNEYSSEYSGLISFRMDWFDINLIKL